MTSEISQSTVTIFGGTGFLGRRIAERLLRKGFRVRIATRHPDRVQEVFSSAANPPEAVQADIMDAPSLAAAIAGSRTLVNAVSLYVEQGETTFERVHVDAASDLATAARNEGVTQVIQISGIGADPASDSPYIRARGRGEEAVANAFSGAIIVRPAVMIGPDDAFLTTLVKLIRSLPLYPMFGNGRTRLQPVYVGDVAEGIARLIENERPDIGSTSFEFTGARVYTYKELLGALARMLGTRVRLMPLPYAAWYVLAAMGERVPLIPITRNQVDLMRHDNVAGNARPGLADLDVKAVPLDDVVGKIQRGEDV